jgi:hypothetical protein
MLALFAVDVDAFLYTFLSFPKRIVEILLLILIPIICNVRHCRPVLFAVISMFCCLLAFLIIFSVGGLSTLWLWRAKRNEHSERYLTNFEMKF